MQLPPQGIARGFHCDVVCLLLGGTQHFVDQCIQGLVCYNDDATTMQPIAPGVTACTRTAHRLHKQSPAPAAAMGIGGWGSLCS